MRRMRRHPRLQAETAGGHGLYLISGAAVVNREIAERFYTSVFAGESPAERLRQERLRMGRTAAAESGTWMAYIYYGHPQMRLKRN